MKCISGNVACQLPPPILIKLQKIKSNKLHMHTCSTSSNSMCTEVRSILATACNCLMYFPGTTPEAAPFSSNLAKKLFTLTKERERERADDENQKMISTQFTFVINVHKDGSWARWIEHGSRIASTLGTITSAITGKKIHRILFCVHC